MKTQELFPSKEPTITISLKNNSEGEAEIIVNFDAEGKASSLSYQYSNGDAFADGLEPKAETIFEQFKDLNYSDFSVETVRPLLEKVLSFDDITQIEVEETFNLVFKSLTLRDSSGKLKLDLTLDAYGNFDATVKDSSITEEQIHSAINYDFISLYDQWKASFKEAGQEIDLTERQNFTQKHLPWAKAGDSIRITNHTTPEDEGENLTLNIIQVLDALTSILCLAPKVLCFLTIE